MNIDFDKSNGLVPAIIQHYKTNTVLMLGYMNEEAYLKTKELGKATFYSRSKERLWTKGETSGNYLIVKDILIDCDQDTILIKAEPIGPTCHTGNDTCFNEVVEEKNDFLYELEKIISDRKNNPTDESYTASLFKKGINKIAQKVGEEATEVIIEAMDNNLDLLKEETSDLIYHLLVLLAEKNISLNEISEVLRKRHQK
ncbi:MAG: bifunctional phosphoribosyl-AMP cyclohydrolase/phosphoribosyl-ATP diphosphatase HisIE [Bacteroidetes bacterium]|nr:bifunctional phosphoribosyl-AMP cyclohydrolase/phosphoribosyl-ATP diphosphatase HisIE [Bacteroidota bacterium]MBU1113806.1 bifunctional phosphoribosyl-AMP cyclohydrolase/phosphoribosyl-ATP diphosphatase HisIE [Bacteroidota bacterium]MBU1799608.1 bifunctional phosphoribosyl-AMP cyclohydrolase/phosphoribosyl-ATP diphosphatase HisIE [Bacteroidota bacterium]